MNPTPPDFTLAERTFESRLRDLNLSPRLIDRGVETGYERLVLHRLEMEVAEVELEGASARKFVGSLETRADLQHPSFGQASIPDRITLQGDSCEGVIQKCANTYMDVVFPALRSLFEGAPAPGTMKIKVTSFTPSLGKAIRWEVFSGQLHLLNDPDAQLAQRLKKQLPLALVFDTLTGHLAEPRLHWCKLYGAMTPMAGLVFGCAIDGQKSGAAEAEMGKKFRDEGELPGQWEFRQFLAMRPAGEADEETARQLKEQALPVAPKKRWWSCLRRS